jgi:serine/threonine protein phosphatase PrpC
VLGVLAVARSIGDHGLKEYVIGRPHVSSTIVDIVEEEEEEDYGEDSNADANSSPYTDGEFLIVACDGLWDVMSDQEAVDLVRIHHREHLVEDDDGREVAASFLVEEALRRGSADNITAVVYWL